MRNKLHKFHCIRHVLLMLLYRTNRRYCKDILRLRTEAFNVLSAFYNGRLDRSICNLNRKLGLVNVPCAHILFPFFNSRKFSLTVWISNDFNSISYFSKPCNFAWFNLPILEFFRTQRDELVSQTVPKT
jgi:hypothetical protein